MIFLVIVFVPHLEETTMFVVPAEIAVIVPFATEAIAGSSEVYLTTRLDGDFFVTLTGAVSPTFNVTSLAFNEIEGFLTVITVL